MPIIGNLTTESLLIALSGMVIVFIMLSVLSLMIVIISKTVGAVASRGASAAPQSGAPAASPVAPPAAAPALPTGAQTAPGGGVVALSGVDELTAACIMAIVSDELGTQPAALIFKSIKAI